MNVPSVRSFFGTESHGDLCDGLECLIQGTCEPGIGAAEDSVD